MTALRMVGLGVGAFALAAALLIAALLVFYRPTIEYAYIDTLSGKETAFSGWWLLGAVGGAVAVVAGLAALVVKLWRKNVAK